MFGLPSSASEVSGDTALSQGAAPGRARGALGLRRDSWWLEGLSLLKTRHVAGQPWGMLDCSQGRRSCWRKTRPTYCSSSTLLLGDLLRWTLEVGSSSWFFSLDGFFWVASCQSGQLSCFPALRLCDHELVGFDGCFPPRTPQWHILGPHLCLYRLLILRISGAALALV